MSASFDSLPSQIAAATPEYTRQVRFTPVSDDAVAADACDGHSSRARRLSSDEAIERFSRGGSYSVRVKNTFIEFGEEEGEEDPAPHRRRRGPRIRTEPNGTVGCELRRGASEASTSASSDEDRSPTVGESAGERARCGSSEELINRFNSGGNYPVHVKNTFLEFEEDGRAPTASTIASSGSAEDRERCGSSEELINRFNSGGNYPVQVKNTFIELEEEDDEEEDPMSLFPRSKTVPNGALSCGPLIDRDGAGSDFCGEDGGTGAAGELAGGLAAQLPTPFCSTPTPRWDASLSALWPVAPARSGAGLALGHAPDMAEHPRRQELEKAPADEWAGERALCGTPDDALKRFGSGGSYSEELINRFNSGSNYPVQVKNTFIELDEDGEEEDPMSLYPRSKTMPNGALNRGPPMDRDGACSGSCDEDGGAPTVSELAGGLAAQLPTPFCSTPTPRWEAPLSALWPTAAHGLALGRASDTPEHPRRQELEDVPAKADEVARRAGAAAQSDGRGPRDPKTMGGVRSLQQQTLQSSEVDGFSRAQWTVDGRKLRSSDKRLVSPSFDLDLGLGSGPMGFVLVLYPKSATFKGSSSFKEAGGLGHVHLKCVSELGDDAAAVKVRLSIGRGRARQLRGPFVHNFAASPLFALPKDQAEWDFGAAVEKQPANLYVSVDVALS